jgi:multidrug efflux pump subunit AcrA (membrane-fusion protein)
MKLVCRVSETDAQKIIKGNKAIITVPTKSHMEFAGKVIKKDKIAKPIKRGSKVKMVSVDVQIDSLGPGLAPGITATCEIITQKIEKGIVVPLESIFEHDSSKVVYVKRKNHFIPKLVEIASQNQDFAVITGGLNEGENVALLEPKKNAIKWPKQVVDSGIL